MSRSSRAHTRSRPWPPGGAALPRMTRADSGPPGGTSQPSRLPGMAPQSPNRARSGGRDAPGLSRSADRPRPPTAAPGGAAGPAGLCAGGTGRRDQPSAGITLLSQCRLSRSGPMSRRTAAKAVPGSASPRRCGRSPGSSSGSSRRLPQSSSRESPARARSGSPGASMPRGPGVKVPSSSYGVRPSPRRGSKRNSSAWNQPPAWALGPISLGV